MVYPSYIFFSFQAQVMKLWSTLWNWITIISLIKTNQALCHRCGKPYCYAIQLQSYFVISTFGQTHGVNYVENEKACSVSCRCQVCFIFRYKQWEKFKFHNSWVISATVDACSLLIAKLFSCLRFFFCT